MNKKISYEQDSRTLLDFIQQDVIGNGIKNLVVDYFSSTILMIQMHRPMNRSAMTDWQRITNPSCSHITSSSSFS